MDSYQAGHELDLLCCVARIEQIQTLGSEDEGLRELLIMRLQYDAHRLRKYLSAESLLTLDGHP